MGEEGELFISIPLGHFPPLAAAILGSPESRGMVKLGNVAPKGMCEAVRPRLQGEDSWFTPYKIKLQLGKEQLGSLYKAMEGEAVGSCRGGAQAMAQGLFWGSLGLAHVRGRASVSSAPGLAATKVGGAWGGVMHGVDGPTYLASVPSLCAWGSHSAPLDLSVTSGEILVPVPC